MQEVIITTGIGYIRKQLSGRQFIGRFAAEPGSVQMFPDDVEVVQVERIGDIPAAPISAERLIRQEMRRQAVASLQAAGTLDASGKVAAK